MNIYKDRRWFNQSSNYFCQTEYSLSTSDFESNWEFPGHYFLSQQCVVVYTFFVVVVVALAHSIRTPGRMSFLDSRLDNNDSRYNESNYKQKEKR